MASSVEHEFHEVATSEATELMPSGLFLLTAAHNGKDNWQFVQRGLQLDAKPKTTVMVVLSQRNFTTELVEASGEFGLAICSPIHAQMVIASRGVTGHTTDDKFAAMGLQRLPARHIQAPLVAGSFANMECRVVETYVQGPRTIYVGEVLAMYHDPTTEPVVHYAKEIYRFRQDPAIG